MKKVTAVLPARNCRRDLHRCLSALSRGDYVPDVIVVDDGSDDGTQQMIREHWPQVTFLSLGAHTGYAHAANAGLRLVRTQYAFLTFRQTRRILQILQRHERGREGPFPQGRPSTPQGGDILSGSISGKFGKFFRRRDPGGRRRLRHVPNAGTGRDRMARRASF